MTKLIKSQRGAIDLVLILVVFATAVGFGGYVYMQQRQAQQGYDSAGNGVTVTKRTKVAKAKATSLANDPLAGWIAYSSAVGDFSLKHPPKWVAPINQEMCNPGMFDRAIYLGPTTATVLKCATEYFGMISVFSVDGKGIEYGIGGEKGANEGTTYKNAVETSVKIGNVTGKRYYGEVKTAADGPGSLPVGTKLINYVFYANGITYVASYYQQPSDPDVSADFDTMVKSTLKFD